MCSECKGLGTSFADQRGYENNEKRSERKVWKLGVPSHNEKRSERKVWKLGVPSQNVRGIAGLLPYLFDE